MLSSDIWRFFDLKDNKRTACPVCGEEGVVFYLSNPQITGESFSAECKNRFCRYREGSLVPDFVENWVLA